MNAEKFPSFDFLFFLHRSCLSVDDLSKNGESVNHKNHAETVKRHNHHKYQIHKISNVYRFIFFF